MLTLEDLSEPAPPPGSADWNDEGVVILRKLIPDDLIKAYEDEWIEACGGPDFGFGHRVHDGRSILTLEAAEPGGWPDCTPYMRHPALRAICTHELIASTLWALLGEPAGVHLNLTGWVSTERDWHQDGYLNPDEVGDFYAAAWIALGDVHPDSGPFQYIPGSHRWHRLVREKFAPHVDMADPHWPEHTEKILTPLMTEKLAHEGWKVETYLPQKGDVLFWHPRLYHRGSRAHVPGAYRPGLIAHYSGIHHHSAMPPAVQTEHGGWLFPIAQSGPVR